MIKKIIVLMILILILINNVNCESGNGNIEAYISSSNDYTQNVYGNNKGLTGDFLFTLNHDTGGLPDSYEIDMFEMINDSEKLYDSIPINLGDPFYIYWSSNGILKDELVGYGSVLIHKKSYEGNNIVRTSGIFYFDEFTKKSGVSGEQKYILDGSLTAIYTYYDNFYRDEYASFKAHYYNENNAVISFQESGSTVPSLKSGYYNIKHEYNSFGSFRNDYNFNVTTSFFDVDIQRIGFEETYDLNSSHIKMVNTTDSTIYYESSDTVLNSSHFLSVGSYNYYIVRQIDDYEHLIYTSYEDEKEEQSTLTTDKTYYNTSELINISFTNIDSIYNECESSICAKLYDLHILYPVTHAYKDYESKYIYPLTYSLEDETITLSTSFLSPENNYILGIVGINGDYHKYEDILLFSNDFVVYPDEEYLSISCDSETSCYTYNNVDITIYYQINNNSNIIIKDNNNNVINTYYNIIGNGSILYHIPDDLYYENTYPNWKVYLNNTEYSTSFNKGITVYWSQFATPTPTPTFTPTPTPDINISDEIDNLKDEISPIKDLLFGLSEIVIDNPDYNKDNIVDENEINHWFNSLIPMCIILLLIILYIGLKKNRND